MKDILYVWSGNVIKSTGKQITIVISTGHVQDIIECFSGTLPVTNWLRHSRKRGMKGHWPVWWRWRRATYRSSSVDRGWLCLNKWLWLTVLLSCLFMLVSSWTDSVTVMSILSFASRSCFNQVWVTTPSQKITRESCYVRDVESCTPESLKKKEKYFFIRAKKKKFLLQWDRPVGKSSHFKGQTKQDRHVVFTSLLENLKAFLHMRRLILTF